MAEGSACTRLNNAGYVAPPRIPSPAKIMGNAMNVVEEILRLEIRLLGAATDRTIGVFAEVQSGG